MKKKLIVGLILLIMILPMFLNVYKVEAFSGELDPKGYISLPMMIWIQDGIAIGTIRGTSGYTISYQKMELTTTQFNNIQAKSNEIKEFVETSDVTFETKDAELDTLKTEWENLKNSETATQEQITAAQNKYNEAVEEYNGLVETYHSNYDKLKTEYYGLIPTYTSSWIETTNTEDNVRLDFSGKSGMIYFILWAKITNGTDTYYDMNIYSQNIKQEENISISKTSANIKVDETVQLTATSSLDSQITWTSSDSAIATVDVTGLVKGVKEGTAVITAKGSEKSATCTVTVGKKESSNETDNGEWTDFSKAKFELKKDGISRAMLEITGVTPKNEKNNYYLFITDKANKLDVTSASDAKISLVYNSDKKIFQAKYIENYIELNQDIYITILEKIDYKNEKIVVSAKKIEKYEEPKYSNAFYATFMTNKADQIVTTFTHDSSNNRKIQIKIGKITDKSILQKIKNEDVSGFASLLSYAKSNKGMYDKLVDANKDDFNIAYDAGEDENTGNSVINLEGLQNEAYYFLYVQTYDENGKYVSNEAVTLAQASVHNDGDWYLFFYGDNDFNWADFGEVKDDDTKAPTKLPNTGKFTIVSIIAVIASVGVIGYIKTKKYKEI